MGIKALHHLLKGRKPIQHRFNTLLLIIFFIGFSFWSQADSGSEWANKKIFVPAYLSEITNSHTNKKNMGITSTQNNPCAVPSCDPVPMAEVCANGSITATLSCEGGLTNVIWYNSSGDSVGTGCDLLVSNALVGDGTTGQTECFYFEGEETDGCPSKSCCPVSVSVIDCVCPLNLADKTFAACPGLEVEGILLNTSNYTNLVYTLINPPTDGQVNFGTEGNFIFTSANFDCGINQFTYQACDTKEGCCDTAIITINFTDTIAPQLYNIPADDTISCDEYLPQPPLVSAYDNCPSIALDVEELSTQGEDGCSLYDYTLTRIWTATDICGNTTSDQQIIEVEDNTAPDIFRIYTLPNGKKMVAGVMENVNQNWKTISFPIDFGTTPLVFAQVISTHETSSVTTRIRNISHSQFELKLQEAEAEDDKHIREYVAWMALEPGNQATPFSLESRVINLDNTWATIPFEENYASIPSLFATMQTTLEKDPAALKFQNPSLTDIQLQIQEDTSADPEVNHAIEQVAFLEIEQDVHLIDEKGRVFGETGNVSIDENWIKVNTQQEYYNPVVIAGVPQQLNTAPGVVRIRKVTANSFEIQFQEWNNEDGIHPEELVAYMVVEGSLPLDASLICEHGTDSLEIGKDIIALDNCDAHVDLQYEVSIVISGNEKQYIRSWYAVDECGNANGLSQVVPCSGVGMHLKAMLQGAMLSSNESGLMRDDLRQKGLLPVKEPYTQFTTFTHVGQGGEEECLPELFNTTGERAIVDWVFVELRDGANQEKVVATCSALIQRNGDIISVNGDSLIYFDNLPSGNYFVCLRHRNHLRAETLHPYEFNGNQIPFIDFTYKFLPIIGNEPFVDMDNKNALWSGDLNQSESVIYQGPQNDIFSMFLQVLLDSLNQSYLPNYINRGYTVNDFNMDGLTIFQGPNNDRANLLFNTILAHPENDNNASNFILSSQENIADDNLEQCYLTPTLPDCDFDGDGKVNKNDPDDDNDGVIDGNDSAPYLPLSDSDGDGFKDKEEKEYGSDPLNPCDPYQDHNTCNGEDKDEDGYFENYPKDHNLYDANDRDACLPNKENIYCGCPDLNEDSYIFVCHTTSNGVKQTLRILAKDWQSRQALGDICDPCQE